jgi:hypothetical protein
MGFCSKLLDPWRGGDDSPSSGVPHLGELPMPSQLYGTQDLRLSGQEFVLVGSLLDGNGGAGGEGHKEADICGPEETVDDVDDGVGSMGLGSPDNARTLGSPNPE